MRIFPIIAVMFITAGFSLSVMASMNYGVDTGTEIPHSLELSDHNGELQSFDKLAGEYGAVLFFVRSVDWCPFCQKQLLDIAQRGGEIEAKGYSLIFVSYDSVELLQKFQVQYDFPYTLLSDPESEAIQAFDILNTEMKEGTKYFGIPHPGVFIISRNGVIKGKLFEEGYKARPEIDRILSAIDVEQ